MSSIHTNAAAMTALKSLQMTNKALEATQKNISTGYRVSDAADNAAYWSIATTMRSDNKALGTVEDALGLGAAKVDVAYTAMNSAIDVVDEIKAKLVASREPGVDKSKIQSEIEALQGQLTSIAESASFSGENWLTFDDDTGTSKSIVSSFTRDNAGSVAIGTIDIDISNIKLFGNDGAGTPVDNGMLNTEYTTANGAGTPVNVTYTIATLDITAADVDDTVIEGMLANVEATLENMTTAAADLGSTKSRIDMQTEFVGNLMDSIKGGIGKLVDADMTEESTRLQALQTQQQLGIQALSMANSGAQSLLSLFRS